MPVIVAMGRKVFKDSHESAETGDVNGKSRYGSPKKILGGGYPKWFHGGAVFLSEIPPPHVKFRPALAEVYSHAGVSRGQVVARSVLGVSLTVYL